MSVKFFKIEKPLKMNKIFKKSRKYTPSFSFVKNNEKHQKHNFYSLLLNTIVTF